jgi:predicted porin
VKGSEDLGNGLKAIYQIELGFSLSDSNNNGAVGNEAITMRNTFAGLGGGWGTVLAGRHDTPLKISTGPLDLFADTMADYNNTVGFMDLRVDNAVAYISPSFSGFTFAAAVHAGGGATAGIPGPAYNQNSDSLAEGYSIAGIYKNGPWYASLAYEGLNGDLACDTEFCDAETWGKWRVGLGMLDWNGFSLTGIYEGWDNGYWADGAKADLWNIQAGYTFGNFMVKAMYGSNTQKDIFSYAGYVDNVVTGDYYEACAGCTDDFNYKTWTFGVDYNMSKRTKAFLLYTANDADELDLIDADGNIAPQTQGIDWNGFQLGMMHNF